MTIPKINYSTSGWPRWWPQLAAAGLALVAGFSLCNGWFVFAAITGGLCAGVVWYTAVRVVK